MHYPGAVMALGLGFPGNGENWGRERENRASATFLSTEGEHGGMATVAGKVATSASATCSVAIGKKRVVL